MNVKEFINKEKTRLQALFEPFNKGGSWMSLFEPGLKPVRLGLIDGYTVIRVAPYFDVKGEIKRIDFWLLFKAVGYDEGFQHAHTVKVIRWSQDDTYLLDIEDDRKRKYHIELIFPDQEPDLASDWKHWRQYKSENNDRFERIDAEILTEHIQIAEEWE
ncbi:MAG: hypothetical protein DRH50_16045 [Deltaproteobacteria bacterium]|nr:MAG: hypothetical protein DRH50_16045 [Deltaproteobacteria bacterium]